MIIGFIIWSIVMVLFVGIGISCRKSDEAVGFFTGCKPPMIEDVAGYNKAVARLCIYRLKESIGNKKVWVCGRVFLGEVDNG